MGICERCVHRPICQWCAENTEFKMPKYDRKCDMLNTDFDDIEEAVSVAFREAKERWNEAREDAYDRTKATFEKGRWSAFKAVLELMSMKGGEG